MIRIRNNFFARNRILRRKHGSSYDKLHLLAENIHRYGVSEFQSERLCKLFLNQAAFGIGRGKHASRAEIRFVQFKIALIDLQRSFHIVAHVFQIHRDGSAALGGGNAGRMTDSIVILPGKRRGTHPEV